MYTTDHTIRYTCTVHASNPRAPKYDYTYMYHGMAPARSCTCYSRPQMYVGVCMYVMYVCIVLEESYSGENTALFSRCLC